MNDPLTDVDRFLAQTPPFDSLEPAMRRRAAAAFEVVYRRSGSVLLEIGEANHTLFLIRRGAVEAHDRHGTLVGRYGEGDSFGLQSLLSGKPVRFRISLIEDGLIWRMPKAAFDALRAASPAFDDFYIRSLEERLVSALREHEGAGGAAALFMTPLSELTRREPVLASPDTPIAQAARTMAEHGISSLLIGSEGSVQGIVTDRDLRNRVLAKGRSPDEPVAAVMTPEPLTVDAASPVLAAIVAMAGRGIHHLPLTREGRVVGMVTTRDLLSLQTHHPLYLAAQIQKQDTVAGVVDACRRIPKLFDLLLASGIRAEEVPKVMTTITDTVTRRLIRLAEAELGPAPAAWAWLAFGSQAREEQSLKTDQDNGIVYDDAAPPDAYGWFAAMARFVCDGLAACGYAYCPGDIMATTPSWRQPLAGWQRQFAEWSRLPDPQAVLGISIFFDLRGIQGDRDLVAGIRQAMADCATGTGKAVFLSALARGATEHDVPLGFFRRFVLESRGEHRETLEIKAAGLMPLTDLVRVRALQSGVTAASTLERLTALVSRGALARSDADRLEGAYRLLSGLRVRLHADLHRRGEAPHNHLDVRRLSHAERVALRDAFVVVREAQRALTQDFPA
ncbi:MAG: cyclic nucleotide-binding/CBS domain-containing protein [Xanthomonadales bacterium]|nr:cyclic nucleotide-binding/CBS domain-containing protein [Xanthomonadales bacterium]